MGSQQGVQDRRKGGADRHLKQWAGAKITGLGITPNHKGLAPNSLTSAKHLWTFLKHVSLARVRCSPERAGAGLIFLRGCTKLSPEPLLFAVLPVPIIKPSLRSMWSVCNTVTHASVSTFSSDFLSSMLS